MVNTGHCFSIQHFRWVMNNWTQYTGTLFSSGEKKKMKWLIKCNDLDWGNSLYIKLIWYLLILRKGFRYMKNLCEVSCFCMFLYRMVPVYPHTVFQTFCRGQIRHPIVTLSTLVQLKSAGLVDTWETYKNKISRFRNLLKIYECRQKLLNLQSLKLTSGSEKIWFVWDSYVSTCN